jgi:adenylate cyclase
MHAPKTQLQLNDLRHGIERLGIGVALANLTDWSVLLDNPKFVQWFPHENGLLSSLTSRLEGFNPEHAAKRLSEGKPFLFETNSRNGGRSVPIAVELKPLLDKDHSTVLVECRDISKQKQMEYMLETYSKMAEKHSRDLEREKMRAEKLLLNIMPRSVCEEMKLFGMVTPQRFDHASILLLDFVGFTDMAISRSPSALVAELNDIFTAFDRIVENFGCERIKTIGDAYMAVAGLPEADPDHAQNLARVALRMKRYIERRNTSNPEVWKCRIGISSGPVVGSILGVHKYVYDIFGPGVNLASRMETMSEAMQITISESTYLLVRDDFVCSERGVFQVKGFGEQKLFGLEGEQPSSRKH